jgi:diacylglycerol kinase (ATP)
MPRRAIILANPFSGSIANRPRVAAFVEALAEHDVAAEVVWDRGAVSQRAAGEVCCIVAAGGDGTVSEVINLRLPWPLAILPLGTENLLAAECGHDDPQALAAAIARGGTRQLDLMQVGDRLASLMVSVGYDADVAHRLARWRARPGHALKRVSRRTYLPLMVQSLAAYEHPPVEMHADDKPPITGSLALVANCPRYGLGFKPLPHADSADGLLDCLVYHGTGPIPFLRFMLAGQRARLAHHPDVTITTARRLTLTHPAGSTPLPAQADGEPLGATPLTITIAPHALTVIDTSS